MHLPHAVFASALATATALAQHLNLFIASAHFGLPDVQSIVDRERVRHTFTVLLFLKNLISGTIQIHRNTNFVDKH